MLIKKKRFNIDSLTLNDVTTLNELMVSNAERFQRFFPSTLSQNITIKSSEKFILKKEKKVKLIQSLLLLSKKI